MWVAEQIALERRVAIKVLTEGAIRTAEGIEQFQREARTTARVEHPNVVRIVDFDVTEEGTPFLVFELLVGETLAKRLRRGPIDLDEAQAILAQTCDALAFMHERGVVHRDIKAENLFLHQARDERIEVKVLDFENALCKTAPLARDPDGGAVDERSDLFSLGACIYHALTKRYPDEALVPMSVLRPDLPSTLDEWFERALAADRDARFATARAMREAFDDAFRASLRTMAVDVPAQARARRRVLPWATAAAIVAAVALLTFVRSTPARLESTAAPAASPGVAPAIVPVVKTPPPSELATVPAAVPIEPLPRVVPVAPKRFVHVTPKSPPPPRKDAGTAEAKPTAAPIADGTIPEFGDRE